jgi:hypothetical protein
MSLHESSAGPWQTGNWRDNGSQGRLTEHRWVLECNNGGSYIPLVLSGRHSNISSHQVLAVDRSLCPNVNVRVIAAEVSGRKVPLQHDRRPKSDMVSPEYQAVFSTGNAMQPYPGIGGSLQRVAQRDLDTQVSHTILYY